MNRAVMVDVGGLEGPEEWVEGRLLEIMPIQEAHLPHTVYTIGVVALRDGAIISMNTAYIRLQHPFSEHGS